MRRLVKKLLKNYNGSHYAYTNQRFIDGEWKFVDIRIGADGEENLTWYADMNWADKFYEYDDKEVVEIIDIEDIKRS